MTKFKIGDKVIPKMPHPWNEICCLLVDVTNDGKYAVSNGQGKTEVFAENKLDHLADAAFEYVQRQIAFRPELQKKTRYVLRENHGS